MLVAIFMALAIICLYILSWIATCGIIKLITMLLGLSFSWAIATAIWLIMILIKACFPSK
jgi:hypothetical protein